MKNYDRIYGFGDDAAIVKLGKQYGIINKQYEEICPIIYDDISWLDSNENILIVNKNDNWGVIDKNNKIIIEIKYNHIEIYDLYESYLKNKKRNLKLNELV
jgi:hypothetical protein